MPRTATATTADAMLAALAEHPAATAAELAAAASLGRSTATKALALLEAARRTPGERDGSRRLPDRWDLMTVQEDLKPSGNPAGPDHAKATERLGKGRLRVMVLEHLRARPGQALSPAAIAKDLGHSAGAIGNALRRLVETGQIAEVSQAPRRYAVPV